MSIKISIHALREEGDGRTRRPGRPGGNFYPRPPRGGRRCQEEREAHRKGISIHALREEGDGVREAWYLRERIFLSTPSARRATYGRYARKGRAEQISIHALREEGDLWSWRHAACLFISIHALREEGDGDQLLRHDCRIYFYPRPPRGGRREQHQNHPATAPEFLSTPSARRATEQAFGYQEAWAISIHALREEGDPGSRRPSLRKGDFYPRPPRGGRRFKRRQDVKLTIFLSTPSARRATKYRGRETTDQRYFYPRPPRGGRPVTENKPEA